MTTNDFTALSPQQQHVMVLAFLLRNALEPFQVEHLTQPQMKELNQRLRYALYDAVQFFESQRGDPESQAVLARLILAIPDYWEVPGRDPNPHPVRY